MSCGDVCSCGRPSNDCAWKITQNPLKRKKRNKWSPWCPYLSHTTNQPWNHPTWHDFLWDNNVPYCLSHLFMAFCCLTPRSIPMMHTPSSQPVFLEKEMSSLGFNFLWIRKGELNFKCYPYPPAYTSAFLFLFFSTWLVNISPFPLNSWHIATCKFDFRGMGNRWYSSLLCNDLPQH